MHNDATDWEHVQSRFADLPGEKGITDRQQAYRPFFLRLGEGVRIEAGCHFAFPERIVIEDDARINLGGLFYGSGGIRIGRHARIGPRVFVHSANHDVDRQDPRAFFERGYDYKAVEIGDNVLISADVRILPGATLGATSFVAAGATVTGKSFNEGSYLTGIPARVMSEPPSQTTTVRSPTAEIAILLPKGSREEDRAYRHLLSALRLPQIMLATSGEVLPPSVVAVLTDGDVHDVGLAPEHVDIWQINRADRQLTSRDGKVTLTLPGDDETLELPTRRRSRFRPRANRLSSSRERTQAYAFWLQDRLLKRNDPLPTGEFLEWAVSLQLLGIAPGREDKLLERVFKALWRRWPEEVPKTKYPPEAATIAERDAIIHYWFDQVLVQARPLRSPDTYPATDLPTERRRKGLLYPAVLVSEARRAHGLEGIKRIKGLLDHAEPHCRNGLRLTALGLAARQLGEQDRHERVAAILASPEWHHEENGLIRVVPGRASILYSPMLISWWRLEGDGALPDGFLNETEETEVIDWCVFDDPEGDDQFKGNIVDLNRRLVSRSLLDVWKTLHAAPSKPSHQRVLIDDAYDGAVAGLERLWRRLFAVMLHRRGRPLLQLSPWPAPFTSACSLRYDVDRPIGAARLRELVALQSRLANAAFGTWYFRRDDPDEKRFAPLLSSYAQAQAKHIEATDEVVKGVGVTHHSAPTSSYWEGDSTSVSLSERQAAYGEFHATELPTARPAWLPNDSGNGSLDYRSECLILTPLHFPLEGGTDDQNLAYFDQRIEAFRQRLENGGHAIVGTHPDLNQEPLEELFKRERLSGVWFTTVEAAVQRQRLLSDVHLVSQDNCPCLLSKHSIADLKIVYWHPDDSQTEHILQLLPGRPRPLPVQAVA